MVSPSSFAGLEVKQKPAPFKKLINFYNMNTLDHVNKCAEFTMSFTIPFKAVPLGVYPTKYHYTVRLED